MKLCLKSPWKLMKMWNSNYCLHLFVNCCIFNKCIIWTCHIFCSPHMSFCYSNSMCICFQLLELMSMKLILCSYKNPHFLLYFEFIPYSMFWKWSNDHLNNDQLITDFRFLILHQFTETPVSKIQRILERAQTSIIPHAVCNNPHVTVFFHFKHNKVLFIF